MNFQMINESEVKYCVDDYCRTSKYVSFGGLHETPLIYAFNDLFLIDANGVLMLKEEFFKQACAWKHNCSRWDWVRRLISLMRKKA